MADRYLLYVDILGFTALVEKDVSKIDELYQIVASLNAHRHSAFRAIVFSDTILVYNVDGGHTPQDRNYLVMFLCEFAQDLQHRLTSRDIFFRAVLVRGEFKHYALNSVPCFFGPALIEAYRNEKSIQAIGLFIHRSIAGDSDIFRTTPFNADYHFAFITQHMTTVEEDYGGEFPLNKWLIEETELIHHLVPELLYLRQLYQGMNVHTDERVRQKYTNTWQLFSKQYPKTVEHLVSNKFDWESISPGAFWKEIVSKFPEDYSWAIRRRVDY